jgi:hypothetical protein
MPCSWIFLSLFSSLHTKAAFAYSSLPLYYSPLAAACPFPSVGVGIWPKQSAGSRNSCSSFGSICGRDLIQRWRETKNSSVEFFSNEARRAAGCGGVPAHPDSDQVRAS